jgi:hypothetical protein
VDNISAPRGCAEPLGRGSVRKVGLGGLGRWPRRARVAEVERLLQVLAVLRAHDGGWVPRSVLLDKVSAYRSATGPAETVGRMAQRDLGKLRQLGFAIDSLTDEGEVARDRLGASAWRLPIDLDDSERRLLVWAITAAGVPAHGPVPATGSAPELGATGWLSSVLGQTPKALGLAHAALAGRRRLVVRREGRISHLEPALIVVRQGRWYLIARYSGTARFYGFRLDRLDVQGIGTAMEEVPPSPADSDRILDAVSWDQHAPVEVEVRCAPDLLGRVRSWFPHAEVSTEGADAVLRGIATNTDAVVDRVLGLGGVARVVSPDSLVAEVRARALACAQRPG